VLLIDELDRTDEPFEAYLLEVLAEYQVTIPELGAIVAPVPPIVVITSNRTREIHDAIKRRCLYHWVDYPNAARELAIVRRKVPGANLRLSREVVAFTQRLRAMDLFKAPGIAETLDWAEALVALDKIALDPETAPPALRGTVTSVRRESGHDPGVAAAAAAVLDRLAVWYDALARDGPPMVLGAWRARSAPWWGRAVEARCGDVVLRGVVRGLDGRGALILDLADGSQRVVLSGEVRELRLES